MTELRKKHFDTLVQAGGEVTKTGVWELAPEVLESVSGGFVEFVATDDFYQDCKKVGDICFRQYRSFVQGGM